MTENKRFVCYFDDIRKKWCVHNTDSLDIHYVADEPMGEEFAHLLNLYQQTLDNVEKENEQLKQYVQSSKEFTKEVEDFFQKCDIDTVNFRVLENLIDADNFIYEKYLKLEEENEQLKQRIKSRLHYYRELCNEFDKDDGFNYNIVKRIVEDLEDISK